MEGKMNHLFLKILDFQIQTSQNEIIKLLKENASGYL